MFAIINDLHLSQPINEFLAPIEQELLPMLSGYSGYQSFRLVRVNEDRAIVIILFDSAAVSLVKKCPAMRQYLSPITAVIVRHDIPIFVPLPH